MTPRDRTPGADPGHDTLGSVPKPQAQILRSGMQLFLWGRRWDQEIRSLPAPGHQGTPHKDWLERGESLRPVSNKGPAIVAPDGVGVSAVAEQA